MTYRRAKAIDTLVAEFNTLFPKRSKISDGWIADADHATRDSDHNPWVKDGDVGVVTAQDITEDSEGGHTEIVDWAFSVIIKNRDRRVKYLIHEGKILRSYDKPGIPAWTWSPYTGTNAHVKHGHISVNSDKASYDSTAPWGLLFAGKPQPKKTPNITEFRLAKTRKEKRAAAAKIVLNGSPAAKREAAKWLDADTARATSGKALIDMEVK